MVGVAQRAIVRVMSLNFFCCRSAPRGRTELSTSTFWPVARDELPPQLFGAATDGIHSTETGSSRVARERIAAPSDARVEEVAQSTTDFAGAHGRPVDTQRCAYLLIELANQPNLNATSGPGADAVLSDSDLPPF